MNYHDKFYNFYSKKLSQPITNRDLLDWCYTGKVADSVKELADSPKISMLVKSCHGNIYRSFDMLNTLDIILKQDKQDSKDEDAGSKLRNSIKSGKIGKKIEQALEHQEKTDVLILGLAAGKGASDPVENLSLDDMNRRRNLTRMLNNDYYKKIMRLFGSLYRQLNKFKKEKRLPDPTSFSNVVLGNNLDNLLMDELLKLADPDMEEMFNYQFIQKQLLEYERFSKQPVGRGNVSIYVDISTSMQDQHMSIMLDTGAESFTLIQVAVALTLVLLRAAADDKRQATIYLFNTEVRRLYTSSMIDTINAVLHIYCSGGTNIPEAMLHSVKNLDDKSDAFFITDACDYVDPVTCSNIRQHYDKSVSKLFMGFIGQTPISDWAYDVCDKVISMNNNDSLLGLTKGLV